MHPHSKRSNDDCIAALQAAIAEGGLSPAEERILDAIEALRRGLYGPDYRATQRVFTTK